MTDVEAIRARWQPVILMRRNVTHVTDIAALLAEVDRMRELFDDVSYRLAEKRAGLRVAVETLAAKNRERYDYERELVGEWWEVHGYGMEQRYASRDVAAGSLDGTEVWMSRETIGVCRDEETRRKKFKALRYKLVHVRRYRVRKGER